MSNIPYLEQLSDGESLTPTKAAALAFQVKTLADAAGPSVVYPISINKGGTGQITQQAAIDALTNSSAATTGQVLKRNSSGNAAWSDVLPYKSYTARLSQFGSGPLQVTVVSNTLGGNIVWTKDPNNAGTFIGTLASAFTENKTLLFISQTSINSSCSLFYNDINTVIVQSGQYGSPTDGLLLYNSIEIRVYP